MLETQVVIRAFSRACAKTGKRIAAKMAIIAITTSSSIRVKAGFRIRRMNDLLVRRQSPVAPLLRHVSRDEKPDDARQLPVRTAWRRSHLAVCSAHSQEFLPPHTVS